MANKIPVSNMPYRPSYLAVSIPVTTTAAKLGSLIETQLGLIAGSLALIWREVQVQVDPETSSGLSVRLGLGNVGGTTSANSVVQKGITLAGQSDTIRAPLDNVDISMIWVQAVSGEPVLNL